MGNRLQPKRDRLAGTLCLCIGLAWAFSGGCRDFEVRSDTANAGAGGDSASSAEGGTRPNGGTSLEGGFISAAGSSGADAGEHSAGSGSGAAEPSGGNGGAAGEGGSSEGGGASGGVGTAGDFAAGSGSGPAPSGPLEPQDFAGLVLWLEPSLDACAVDEQQHVNFCQDLSGWNNHMAQADQARQPQLQADVVNAHDALIFEPPTPFGSSRPPVTLHAADANSLHFGRGDFTCTVVTRWRNKAELAWDGDTYVYSGYGTLLFKTEADHPYRGFALFANYPNVIGATYTHSRFAVHLDLLGTVVMTYQANLNDDEFRVFTTRRSGSVLELRVNGQPDSHTQIPASQDTTTVGNQLILGGVEGAPFRGDVLELVLISGNTPVTDIARLEQHYIEKFTPLN